MATPESRPKFSSSFFGRLVSTLRIPLDEHPSESGFLPLLLVSCAALYIEVLLIRWIGTEIRIFAYFQNLTLIAAFLGFGVGCYNAGKKKLHLFDAISLGILVVIATLPIPKWRDILEVISMGMAFSSDAAIWTKGLDQYHLSSILAIFLISSCVVTIFLLLLTSVMVPLGQWVGTYLNRAKNPVRAYTANLTGSLIGIWLFAGLAYLHLSPVVWFGLALLMYVTMRGPSQQLLNWGTILLLASVLLLHHVYRTTPTSSTYWTPYQKLEVNPAGESQYQVNVNNVGYMSIANVSSDYLRAHPDVASNLNSSSYDAPFRFIESRDRVLIVGGGAGNDADAALRNGAVRVDVVEIDPVIYSLGKRLHPDHPYDSPKVHVILDDARSYLRRSKEQYDVIVFGLVDSHTTISGYSNMRIDNYVYTEDSFREAKNLLKPTGVLVLKFEVRQPWTWMGERFHDMLTGLFGRAPLAFYAKQVGGLFSATVFLESKDPQFWSRVAQPDLASFVSENPPVFSLGTVPPPKTTDDWPYIYHRGRTIPRAYLTISVILLVFAILLVRRDFVVTSAGTWNFFFLGAGFLLLETQMVSRLALYFGSTWLVNCIVLSAILLVLVLANLCVDKLPPNNLRPFYVALVACLLGIYFVPWERLPFGARGVGIVLTAAYCLPLFCAGIIFSETFRRTADRSIAFGSNIVGSVVGGLAQNISFVIGLNALLLLAAGFYFVAGILSAAGLRPNKALTEALPDSTA